MPFLIPDNLDVGTRKCIMIEIPDDPQWSAVFWGHFAELTRWFNHDRDPTGSKAKTVAAVWMDIFQQAVIADCPETPEISECCVEYPASHPIVQFAPNDPYRTPDHTPFGYLFPPWQRVETEGGIITGSEVNDAVLSVASMPPLLIPALFLSGFPRFNVQFSGSGTIELHFLEVPLGGYAVVVVDNDPLQANIVNLSTVTTEDLSDLAALADLIPLVTAANLVQRDILEVVVDGGGDHRIDVTFIPAITIGTEGIGISGFGGGIRKVVFCGNVVAEEAPVSEFRIEGCELQTRPNPDADWVSLGNMFAGLSVAANTLPAGSEATVNLEGCLMTFGIPEGEQGEQGEPGESGEDLDCVSDYRMPTNPDFLCRGARIMADVLTDEIYASYFSPESNEDVGLVFQGVLPPSMQQEAFPSIFELVESLTVSQRDFVILILEGEIDNQNDMKAKIACLLFNLMYPDSTLEGLETYGESLFPSDGLTDPISDAMADPSNMDFVLTKLAQVFFDCIAIQYARNVSVFKYVVYYESNISCATGIEDCTGCLPVTEWEHVFDFALDNQGFSRQRPARCFTDGNSGLYNGAYGRWDSENYADFSASCIIGIETTLAVGTAITRIEWLGGAKEDNESIDTGYRVDCAWNPATEGTEYTRTGELVDAGMDIDIHPPTPDPYTFWLDVEISAFPHTDNFTYITKITVKGTGVNPFL